MKEDEENQRMYTAWINEEQKIVSFQKADGFEEMTFPTHEDKFAYVVRLCESGYRIQ